MNPRRSNRILAAGFTLIEVLVAIAIMGFLAMMLYGAFAQMKRSKEGVERINDRYREGRLAMARMARELQSAYLSGHEPIAPTPPVQSTLFRATPGIPGDRVDFTSFAYRRLDRDSRESDQAEFSYFTAPDPDKPDQIDLVRRVSPELDLEPEHGGRVEILATDVDLFDLQFLDPMTGQWVEEWDTTQGAGQLGRLPLQVRVILVLNGGQRQAADRGQDTIRLVTKVAIPINNILTFATQGGA